MVLKKGVHKVRSSLASFIFSHRELVIIANNFPQVYQLLIPSWGTGFSVAGYVADKMSLQIGISHILAVIAGIIIVLFYKQKRKWLIVYMLIVFLISILLMLDVSLPLWSRLSWMQYFQFPWRLLAVVILTSSFIAAYISVGRSKYVVVGFMIIAVLFYLPYTKPVVYKPRDDLFYLSNPTWTQGTATTGNSFRARTGDKEKINGSLARRVGNMVSVLGLLAIVLIKTKHE